MFLVYNISFNLHHFVRRSSERAANGIFSLFLKGVTFSALSTKIQPSDVIQVSELPPDITCLSQLRY